MNKSAILCSLFITTTILSAPVLATSLEEQRENSHHGHLQNFSINAIQKDQIKASEEIGAFLGTCVPQMRFLKDWVIGPSSESPHSLTIKSMISSAQQDHDAVLKGFKQSVINTVDELVNSGLLLAKDYSLELNTKKLGDLSAHSILASLLARIYEIELSFEKAFPPYDPHTRELSPYYKLHQTFQKEKESLQKRQQGQEAQDFHQEEELPLENKLAALTRELEQKFQKAQKRLKRLTVVLPEGGIPDFSCSEPSEEPTDLLVSPRNNPSPRKVVARSEPSSPHNGSVQPYASQDEGTSPTITPKQEKADEAMKRGRAMSALSLSTSSITSSSAPSFPTVSNKPKKVSHSESMGKQIVSPHALKQSPIFKSRTNDAEETTAIPVSAEGGDSPKKRSKSHILKSFKNPFNKKRSNSEENASSSSSGGTTPSSSSPPEKQK